MSKVGLPRKLVSIIALKLHHYTYSGSKQKIFCLNLLELELGRPWLVLAPSYYHIYTGMCACQQGVTGSMCESCLPQHWDFTADGCKSCQCELDGAVGCNVDTGVCQCLAGVTGDKCDR